MEEKEGSSKWKDAGLDDSIDETSEDRRGDTWAGNLAPENISTNSDNTSINSDNNYTPEDYRKRNISRNYEKRKPEGSINNARGDRRERRYYPKKTPLGFGTGLEKPTYQTIRAGIEELIKGRGRLYAFKDYLFEHIDHRKVDELIGELYETNISANGELNLVKFKRRMMEYVLNAGVFDDTAKEIILRESLKRREGFIGFFERLLGGFDPEEIRRGEKKLDDIVLSFKDIYHLMESGDYAEKMPELAEATRDIYKAGFFDVSLDLLKKNNKLSNSRYAALKRALVQKTESAANYVQKTIESHAASAPVYQSVAAILGILGLMVLIANNSVTGNVVGISAPKTNIYGILSAIMLLLGGVYLFVRSKNN